MSATTADALDEEIVVQHKVISRTTVRQRVISGILLVLLGAVTIEFLGMALHASHDATLRLGSGGVTLKVPDIVVSGRWSAVLLGALIVVLGGWQLARGFTRRAMPWVTAGALVAFMIAFLCWVSARGDGTTIDVVGLLQNSIALAVPLILGALAGVLCERSGVINVAIEGQMLAGAWAAALVGSLIGSYYGLLGAMVAGALMGVLLALFSIKYLVNQVVLGVVLNVFALGLTGFFYDAFMQPNAQSLNSPQVLQSIDIPLLSKIPILGPLLFQANIVVYLAYVLIVVIDVALFRTRWGLRTRALGEHPKAADTVGIKVLAMRYRNVVLGGAVAGLGGAYFTVGAVGAFAKNITSGNGFIALAALIFGRWSPRGAVGAALLFGFASALQTLLAITVPSIPSNFLAMLPYLATIFAVAGLVGRVRAPAADGEPYVKG
ncbi:ABC transporter permease [Nocardioides terrisoli]|uniref:ABC transporter permease n=1 Tax=Nocardioides terrisoli TaxID=3388267 RepID=UPI00287BC78D|nr:ABC transporter permease [Nocardioides marmorisolisilvae]